MKANIPLPTQVSLAGRDVVIDIVDDGKKVGEIVFDPEDNATYQRFIELMQLLFDADGKVKSIRFEEGELERLDEALATGEEFEAAGATLQKMKGAFDISAGAWKTLCAGLDGIFGEGVCACFTRGRMNPRRLEPLLDAVEPYYNQARKQKTAPYRVKK